MGGANIFGATGDTVTLNSGTVNVNSATAFGNSNNTVVFGVGSGVTLGNTSGTAVNLGNYTYYMGNSLAFNGPSSLNLGNGYYVFTGTTNIAVNSGTLTMGGVWAESGNGDVYNITKSGTGTLTLAAGLINGDTTTAQAVFTLAAGTLNINSPAALGPYGNTGNAPLIVIDDSTTIGNTSGASILLGYIPPSGLPGYQFEVDTGYAMVWNGNFTFNGPYNLTMGAGTVTLGIAGGSVSTSRTVTVNTGTFTVSGPIVDGIANTLIKAGAGTLALTGANVFDGGMVLNAGTLDINSNTAIGSGTFTINGGSIDATAGGITLSNNNAEVWNADVNYIGTDTINTGSGAVSLGTNAVATRNITVGGTGTLTIGGGISNGTNLVTPTTNLTKLGSGTLVLSGTSTYTGATKISNGILNAAYLASIGIASSIGEGNGASTASNAASLVLDGGTLQYTNSTSVNTTRLFTLTQNGGTIDSSGGGSEALVFSNTNAIAFIGSGARTLTLTGNSGGANTLASALGDGSGGSTSLVKNGTTIWVLSGSNTYSGGTTLNAGTLNINNANALGTGTFTINNGATLGSTVGATTTLAGIAGQVWSGTFTYN